jgi:hypothetical protein
MVNLAAKTSSEMLIPRRMYRNTAFRKLNANSIFVFIEFLYRRKVTQVPTKVGKGKEWVISNMNVNIVISFNFLESAITP